MCVGGVYDPDGDGDGSVKDGMKLSTDVDTLRNCALRETFEETGILPLKPGTAANEHNMTHAYLIVFVLSYHL